MRHSAPCVNLKSARARIFSVVETIRSPSISGGNEKRAL
jgi:hypothetical protein